MLELAGAYSAVNGPTRSPGLRSRPARMDVATSRDSSVCAKACADMSEQDPFIRKDRYPNASAARSTQGDQKRSSAGGVKIAPGGEASTLSQGLPCRPHSREPARPTPCKRLSPAA